MASTHLQPGANTSLSGASTRPSRVTLAVGWSPPNVAGLEVDASAFLLAADGQVRSDDDMVFYNNPRTGDGAVALASASASERQAFTVELNRLPAAIDKVAFCVTIHDGETRRQTFGSLQSAWVRALDADTGQEIARFDVPLAGRSEVAMVFCEIYRRQQEWKLRAVGQGFNGGLAPLAAHFGVVVASPAPPPAPSSAPKPLAAPPPPKPAAAPPPPPAAPPPKPVRLEKITLEKRAPISLEKGGRGFGEIVINLNWNQNPSGGGGGGFFARLMGPSGIDLDLGCLYKLRTGQAGAVQALGNAFGSLQQPPYVQLMGDDRTGADTQGEFLHINGRQWDALDRVLIYAFIYQGVPNWAATDAVITIRTPDQPTLEIRLDSHRNDQNMCALALLENDRGNIRVTKLVEYYRDHQVMDQAHGFGLRWVAGRKD